MQINIYSVLCKINNFLSKIDILKAVRLGIQVQIKELALEIDSCQSANENFKNIVSRVFGQEQDISTLIEYLFAFDSPSPDFDTSYNSIASNISETII